MQALEFWKTVTVDHANLLESLIGLLREHQVKYCVIGGQAVNAYAEPLVSLDLDLVIAISDFDRTRSLLATHFSVEQFPQSINISSPDSSLRVQIQTDPRYLDFPERATDRDVLGLALPVASLDDLLQGKIWAAGDPERRPTKRQKDLLDIARLIEKYPRLRGQVPVELLKRISLS
jgi:hypothetical protein